MPKTFVVLVTVFLALAIGCAEPSLCQCKNQIVMLPIPGMRAASKPRDFVRFKYALSSVDSLLIRSHEDTETFVGPYDVGFVIARGGTVIRSVTLRTLPEFQREKSFFSETFTTVAVTSACKLGGTIYFVTMKHMGDVLSPALVFVIVPSVHGYKITALPMFSGGTVDVFSADPLHLRVWHNLHEGECNACKTAYRVTEYEIRGDKPVRTRRYRTRRLYYSGQFDESRIRFIP